MDTMFLPTNNATLKLLQLAGCDIVIRLNRLAAGHCMGIAVKKTQGKSSRNKISLLSKR